MKYMIFVAVAVGCHAQTISTLTADLQRTPTAALYVERAVAYLNAGDARQAITDTDRALDRDALNVRALTVRGQANFKLGRYSATISDFSGAIALAPTDAALYMARSEAYSAAGDSPRAQADRNEALRLNPAIVAELDKKPVVVTQAAPAPEVVVPANKPAPVVAPVKTAVATPPPAAVTAPVVEAEATPDNRYQRAKALLNDGKHAEAIAELNEAILQQPSNAILFNTRGYAYYLTKNIQEALHDYDEALRLNPDYLNATHNRFLARRSVGDTAGAAEDRKRELALGKKLGIKVQ